MSFDPLSAVLDIGSKIIDRVIPDKNAARAAKDKLVGMELGAEMKELEAAMNIIVAEASSEHWLVAAWRPITMLVFVAIVGNNYLIYPYLALFWNDAPVLTLPPDLWDLLKIGLGGYVVGRSAEKIVKSYASDGEH